MIAETSLESHREIIPKLSGKEFKMVSRCKYWVRKCKTPGCHGLACPLSDYCIPCHNKRKEKLKEVLT